MKYGIIAPMHEEVEFIINEIQQVSVSTISLRNFYQGFLFGHEVVVVTSGIGKVASSSAACILSLHFKVDAIVLIGVAGAIKEELYPGDIVIATNTIQHDMDCRPIFPLHIIPHLQKSYFECHPNLVKRAELSANTLLKHELSKHIDAHSIQLFSLDSRSVFLGTICCGDQFIDDNLLLNTIKNDIPTALCVEMEAGAVGQICYENSIPFVVIRSISDSANHEAPIDFNFYLEHVSRKYTLAIIKNFLLQE